MRLVVRFIFLRVFSSSTRLANLLRSLTIAKVLTSRIYVGSKISQPRGQVSRVNEVVGLRVLGLLGVLGVRQNSLKGGVGSRGVPLGLAET